MIWLADALTHEFLLRALLAAALAGALNGYLGIWIVLRGWTLAAESLSHALFPGLAAAVLLAGVNPLALGLGGVLSALAIGGGAQVLAQGSRVRTDTALGILYPAGYAVGIVLVSLGKVRVELDHWLFGNIFGLASRDLWLLWGAALLLRPLLVASERPLLLATFEPQVARSCGVRMRMLGAGFAAAVVLERFNQFRSRISGVAAPLRGAWISGRRRAPRLHLSFNRSSGVRLLSSRGRGADGGAHCRSGGDDAAAH
jgi:manganese transport system permease protein